MNTINFLLSKRKTARTMRAECAACGKYNWISSTCEGYPVCDSCDRKVWRDDRDSSQFDAATEQAQGVA